MTTHIWTFSSLSKKTLHHHPQISALTFDLFFFSDSSGVSHISVSPPAPPPCPAFPEMDDHGYERYGNVSGFDTGPSNCECFSPCLSTRISVCMQTCPNHVVCSLIACFAPNCMQCLLIKDHPPTWSHKPCRPTPVRLASLMTSQRSRLRPHPLADAHLQRCLAQSCRERTVRTASVATDVSIAGFWWDGCTILLLLSALWVCWWQTIYRCVVCALAVILSSTALSNAVMWSV